VASFYDIDAANDRLSELGPVLALLRDQRDELVRLRDQALEHQARVEAEPEPSGGGRGAGGGSASTGDDPGEEMRLFRLRMQGVVDQMQAAVAQIDGWGVTLRDIPSGLVDFPALVNGRQVWLCWRLGEDRVDWWHELTTGVAGRRPIIELE